MRKFLGGLPVVLGCLFFYAAMLQLILPMAEHSRAQVGPFGVFVVLGALLVWSGTRLLPRWHLTAGVTGLVLALSSFGNAAGSWRLAGQRPEGASAYRLRGSFLLALGVIVAVVAVMLIIRHRRGGSQAAPSPAAADSPADSPAGGNSA